ncbi:polysaccharide biosynthesis/export family protein [Sinorhizobium sp. BG8]|uniref:polysaccharide biosynthesis/export family protein n=1 Tax=Sinorhizobium sp. BG8 TaxID=2613773 RepID=UPI001FEF8384|nr:polysaccharide biosynthesis/export family protein [Sinorhizobium sp. BG8]
MPSAGPDSRSIEANAYARVEGGGRSAGIDYALADIDAEVLAAVASANVNTLSGFGQQRSTPAALPLGVGDLVQVSIFEAQAGGLFIPVDATGRPGNFVSLPVQTIDRDGSISVPYAGRLRASGRSIAEVEAEVQRLLSSRAIEPQAVVTVVKSRSSQVAVLGDVKTPARLELNPIGDRILDVISEAGGLSAPSMESYVTLQRGPHSVTVPYTHLAGKPEENIYVRPGDTIFVNREQRTFLAFGASGLNGRFDFENCDLTLGEALAKAGGLLDTRADPAQVLLYRRVPRALSRQLGIASTRFVAGEVPMIFRANLRDPATFFAVQKFPMQDKDIIYVSNAPATELLKFLHLINAVSTTPSNVVDTRDAVRTM